MRVDVAVVGAGPAGSWAATRLARAGARVALIDASHPREKPCGGGLTGRALALVGAEIPADAFHAVRIRRARFVDGATSKSAVVELDTAPGPQLVVASRTGFDGMLYDAAQRAGAHLVRARVTSVVRSADGVQVTTPAHSVRARWVIAADGANSLVRRRVAGAFRREDISIATGFFCHGVTSDEVVIEIVGDPPGYIWSFPRPDHLAIGICTQADQPVTSGALRARVAEWIRATRIAPGARLEAYSWPIPSLSARAFARLPLAGEGWMAIGDAAGLVDPITREGIFFALQSASFATDALIENDATGHARFAERVRAEIVDDLARASRLKASFFRPRFTGLLIEALARSASIRGVMADLVAGAQSYRDLKWRLLKTLELGLAWRVVTARDSRRARARGPSADSR
jgi:geranylgeranyl reductase family protein